MSFSELKQKKSSTCATDGGWGADRPDPQRAACAEALVVPEDCGFWVLSGPTGRIRHPLGPNPLHRDDVISSNWMKRV
jgi:hypothetical protein